MKKLKSYTPDFLQIPQIVMHMAPSDRFVFGAIYFYCQLDDKKCRASNVTLGKVAGITPESVANSLTRLEAEGLIKRFFVDSENKHRDYIICLVSFGKVSSGDASSIIKQCIRDSSNDEQNIIHKDNINIQAAPEDTSFNINDEIARLQGYKEYWLNIIGTYVKVKKPIIQNKKQLDLLVKKYMSVAKDIAAYEPDQIKRAMLEAKEIVKDGKPFDWTLYTVRHILSK